MFHRLEDDGVYMLVGVDGDELTKFVILHHLGMASSVGIGIHTLGGNPYVDGHITPPEIIFSLHPTKPKGEEWSSYFFHLATNLEYINLR